MNCNTNCNMNRKLYVFDLDSTLHERGVLFPDVKDILYTLKKQGHRLYIASFNKRAPDLLKQLEIWSLFNGGSFGIGTSKFGMIKEIIRRESALGNLQQITNIEFYDDKLPNVLEVLLKGNRQIRSVHVTNGLTWENVNLSKKELSVI